MTMKRFLLLFSFFATVIGHPVSAQISIGAGYLKTQASGAYKNVSGDGFYAGLSYRIPLNGSFSLVPGLFFTRTNEQLQQSLTSSFRTDDNCVEKALLASVQMQWGVNLSSRVRAFLYAGPSFQFGLQCQVPSGVNNQQQNLYVTSLYGPSRQCWNVWAGGGAGISLPILSRYRLFVIGGWDYGLVNLYSDPGYKSHRSLWKVGAGFEF